MHPQLGERASISLLVCLLACGSSSPSQSPDASVVDASSDVGAMDGGARDVTAQDAPPQGDASDGDAGTEASCQETAGTVACADAGSCSTPMQVCCGPVGPPGDTDNLCTSPGGCLAGGVVAAHCDDTADCSGGQICCVAPGPGGTDVQWLTQCQTPLAFPDPPCGSNGIRPYDHLCSCSYECSVGPCQPGASEATLGRTVCVPGA